MFSRQPDYFDSEQIVGTIHFTDSGSLKIPVAVFMLNKFHYRFNASYLLRELKEGEKVDIIYDTANPAKAALYRFWGYWLRWDELLFSLALFVSLFYAAQAITSNPVPEALIEEMEMGKPKRRKKYSD